MHALLHIIFNISKLSVSIGDLSRNIWWCNISDKWFDQEILLFNCIYAPPSGLASTIVFAGFSVVCQKFWPSRTIRQTLRYTINVSLILQYNFSFFLLQGHEREEWLCLLGANSFFGWQKKSGELNRELKIFIVYFTPRVFLGSAEMKLAFVSLQVAIPKIDFWLFTVKLNDTHREKLVLYWIQYKNLLKNKVGCFWRFS